jgi:hypothetical protein
MSAQSRLDLPWLNQPRLLMIWLLPHTSNSVNCIICLWRPLPTLSLSMWSGCLLTFNLPQLTATCREYVTNWRRNIQLCVQSALLVSCNELSQAVNVVILIPSNEKNPCLVRTSTQPFYAFMSLVFTMTYSSLRNYILVLKHFNVSGNLYGLMPPSSSLIIMFLCVTWCICVTLQCLILCRCQKLIDLARAVRSLCDNPNSKMTASIYSHAICGPTTLCFLIIQNFGCAAMAIFLCVLGSIHAFNKYSSITVSVAIL